MGCAASATTPTRWRRRRGASTRCVRRVVAVPEALRDVGWDLKQVHLDGDGGFLERGSGE